MAAVQLSEVQKSFGKVTAVDHISLEIDDGEFFSLLGPSGCGKTTILRMIAGFETPNRGRIFFEGNDVTSKRPNQRNTGMVFQNYALFPHLSVFENVAFGLKARKQPADKIQSKVSEALQLVGMKEYEKRLVTQLSGGQQQRVALARAIAIEPEILLLDEPLSNLDAQLRKSTRAELKRLQRNLGITTIYVTHDQEEALALSDRIAVINNGKLQQVDEPQKIYNSPANLFVMTFIGESNVLSGNVAARDDAHVKIRGSSWELSINSSSESRLSNRQKVKIGFRPENVRLHNSQNDPKTDQIYFRETRNLRHDFPKQPESSTAQRNDGESKERVLLKGKWHSIEYAGTHWLLHVNIDNTRCTARLPDRDARELLTSSQSARETVALEVSSDQVFIFDTEGS